MQPGDESVTTKRSYPAVLGTQLFALTLKTVLMLRYRWVSSLLIIFVPVFMVLGMWGLYKNLSTLDISPQSLAVQPCVSFDVYGNVMPASSGPACVSAYYAPDNQYTRAIMQRVAADAGLSFGSDIVPLADVNTMAGFVFDSISQRQVDIGVEFNETGLGSVTYALWVNTTRFDAYNAAGLDLVWRGSGAPGRLMAWQRAIDGAIIAETAAVLDGNVASSSSSFMAGVRNGASLRDPASASSLGGVPPSLDATFAPFTDYEDSSLTTSLGAAVLMLAISGAAFPVVGVCISAILVMTMVTGEKARRLVGALRTIGLLDSAYWSSWLLASVPLLLLLAIVTAATGRATGIELYTDCDFSVHFIALFMLATSTVSMALACASCIRSQRAVNISAFCLFTLAAVLTVVFAMFGLYGMIYTPSMPPVVAATVAPMPWFHYGRLIKTVFTYIYYPVATPVNGTASVSEAAGTMFTDLSGGVEVPSPSGFGFKVFAPMMAAGSGGAASHLLGGGGSSSAGSTMNGRHYTWDLLSQAPPPQLVMVDGQMVEWQDHAPSFDLCMMLALTAGYLLLAWYLGQVFTGDLGAAQPFLFPLSPHYWGCPCARPPRVVEAGDTIGEVQRLSEVEGSVRVHKLSKSYGKSTAVKEVSMMLPPGQVTCILGHNGAGKSTLIHCLCGLVAPSEGEAFLFGRSMKTDMSTLRQDIGICPQDDLLWEELSAEQHLAMYARFKNVRPAGLGGHVSGLLDLVKLANVRAAPVDTFSGGMKRRLSVALAAVGDVKMLVLDEPSSGLDPLSRRRVHGMIEQLKPGRVVILTTHAMEEADMLGDSVAIMANSRLRAYGTPLFLKSRYGAGYQINILTTPDNVLAVKALVKTHLAGSEFVGDAATGEDSGSGNGGNPTAPMGHGAMYLQTIPGQAPIQALQGQQYVIPASSAPLTPGAAPATTIIVPASATGTGATAVPASGTLVSAVTGANSSDLLQSRQFSGSVTVAVPRALLPRIPAFLRLLSSLTKNASSAGTGPADDTTGKGSPSSGSGMISEFGIANSTLEEVFLRLAANASEVNAGIAIAGGGSMPPMPPMPMPMPGGMTMPVPMGMQGGGAASGPLPQSSSLPHPHTHASAPSKTCALCGCAPVSPVTLFTSQHVEVLAPDLICGPCATRTKEEIQALALASKQGTGKLIPDSSDDVATDPEVDATGTGTGRLSMSARLSRAMGVGAIASGPPAVEMAPLLPGAIESPSALVGGGSGAGAIATAATAASVSSPSSIRLSLQQPPTAATSGPTDGVTATAAGVSKPSAGWRPRKRNAGDVKPVSFWSQFAAILLLRFQLQYKQRWANVCNICFILIAVVVTLITSPAVKPVAGVKCVASGGFYVDYSLLCNRANFTQYLATTFTNTLVNDLARAAPVRGDANASLTGTGTGASASRALVSQQQQADGNGYRFNGNSWLLFTQQCMHFDPQGGWCLDFTYPTVPDWSQAHFTYINSWLQQNLAVGTNIGYVDGPDASDVPLSQYDLLGIGAGNASVPSYATFVNLASPPPALHNAARSRSLQSVSVGSDGVMNTQAVGATIASTGDLDAFVTLSQRTIQANSKAMPQPCTWYGTWDSGSRVGWLFNSTAEATAWMTYNLPSVGLVVRRSRPADAVPTFYYDMRQWALAPNEDWSPNRGSEYTWTSIYQSINWGSGPQCYTSDLNYYTDAPFDNSYGNSGMPGPAAISALHNAFLRQVVKVRTPGTGNTTIPSPHIFSGFVLLPNVRWAAANPASGGNGNVNIQSLLWPLFTIFLLPIFVYAVSHEKATKLHALLTMGGMRQSPYMAANYAFSMVLFLFVGIIYIAAGFGAGVAVFRHTNPGVFIALLLTWGHAQAGWGIFLGSALRNPRAATVCSYMLIVIVSVVSLLLNTFLSPWPKSLNWVPFISYTRASTLLLTYGAQSIDAGSELQSTLLITAFEGTLALLAGLYLHAVLPGPEQTGVTRHPLFPLQDARDLFVWLSDKMCTSGRSEGPSQGRYESLGAVSGLTPGAASASSLLHSTAPAGRAPGGHSYAPIATPAHPTPVAAAPLAGYGGLAGNAHEDVDVTEERQRIVGGQADDAPVIIYGLCKTYPARLPAAGRGAAAPSDGGWLSWLWPFGGSAVYGVKHAVRNLTLSVEKGACLGLLGVNGAGKTTTISAITGHTTITSGGASVNGFDVATQMPQVWTSLGICPQFDTVWDELTVYEHLALYARIKGIPSKRLRAVVQRVAEKIGLDGDAKNQAARGLSGGMRRRLSIGIALIGDPAVIILDEPSTGVDPAARRDIWRIIQSERESGRAMIITTHSMEEADALCSKIAIMHAGKLQCVGSQLRLKSRFGDGYKLTVTGTSDAALAATEAYVKASLCPSALVVSRTGMTATFLLPMGGAAIADVFQAMEAQKGALGLQDVGLSMTTLDEVFVKVVENAERAEAAENGGTLD